MADFVSRCPKEEGQLPRDVRALLPDILLKINAPFTGDANPLMHYLPLQQTFWSFFPALPAVHGAGNYDADRRSPPSDEDSCRRYLMGTLT